MSTFKTKMLATIGGMLMLGSSHCVSADSSQSQAQEVSQEQKKLQAAFDFIDQQIIATPYEGKLDLPRAEAAVEMVSKVLSDKSLSPEMQLYHRKQRAAAYATINFHRLHKGDLVIVSEAVQALDDIEFWLKYGKNKHLDFQAGRIAMHLVKDAVSAYRYWQSCAEQDHAGCMNVLAENYFSGTGGIPADLVQSVYWHQQVADTGVNYGCAGLFSNYLLAQTARYLPNVKTGQTWQYWAEQGRLLYLEVQAQYEMDNICNMSEYLFLEYTMGAGQGKKDAELLSKAINKESDAKMKSIWQGVATGKPIETLVPLLDDIEHPEGKCSATFNLLMYAKAIQAKDSVATLSARMTLIDPEACTQTMALMNHMKAQGTWD